MGKTNKMSGIDIAKSKFQLHGINSTSETPLERFISGIQMVRASPDDLTDYFRKAVMRTVTKSCLSTEQLLNPGFTDC